MSEHPNARYRRLLARHLYGYEATTLSRVEQSGVDAVVAAVLERAAEIAEQHLQACRHSGANPLSAIYIRDQIRAELPAPADTQPTEPARQCGAVLETDDGDLIGCRYPAGHQNPRSHTGAHPDGSWRTWNERLPIALRTLAAPAADTGGAS